METARVELFFWSRKQSLKYGYPEFISRLNFCDAQTTMVIKMFAFELPQKKQPCKSALGKEVESSKHNAFLNQEVQTAITKATHYLEIRPVVTQGGIVDF